MTSWALWRLSQERGKEKWLLFFLRTNEHLTIKHSKKIQVGWWKCRRARLDFLAVLAIHRILPAKFSKNFAMLTKPSSS